MAYEYTPELNADFQNQQAEEIKKRTAASRGAAQADAISRGFGGDLPELAATGAIDRSGNEALAKNSLDIGMANADRLRQERLTKEGQAFSSGEAQKGRDFNASEAEKTRRASADQNELDFKHAKELDAEGAGLKLAGDYLGGRGGRGFGGPGGEGDPSAPGGGGGGGLLASGLALAGKYGKSLYSGARGLFGGGAKPTPGGGMSPAGSLLAGGALAYGGAKLGRAIGTQGRSSSLGINRSQKAGNVVGGAAGYALGGPIGAGIGSLAGGAIGGSIAKIGQSKPAAAVKSALKKICFEAGTLVEMANGSKQWILNIKLGDHLKGGFVNSVRQSICDAGDLYDYEGVLVTGSHAVLENGVWIRVENSPLAVKLVQGTVVYSLVTTEHRIFAYGANQKLIEFSDEFETDSFMDITAEDSLAELNKSAVLSPELPVMQNHRMPD